MRCNMCDKALSDTEISWNKDLGAYEPCSVCLEAAMDAAYSGNFRHDEEVEEEIGDEYGDGEVEILDADTDDTAFGEGYDLGINDYD